MTWQTAKDWINKFARSWSTFEEPGIVGRVWDASAVLFANCISVPVPFQNLKTAPSLNRLSPGIQT
jgi:hypothetical protein